jgi:large subunit ribosomal protein LP0
MLLDKLKIYPFSYKMEIRKVLQDGSMFDAAVLELSTEAIIAKFQKAINNQANLSLGLGYSTSASAPHTLLGGFKNLVAFSAASGYEFKQAKDFLSAAASAPAGGAPAAAGKAADAGPVEAAVVEEKEEVDMGNLFGDEEEDY